MILSLAILFSATLTNANTTSSKTTVDRQSSENRFSFTHRYMTRSMKGKLKKKSTNPFARDIYPHSAEFTIQVIGLGYEFAKGWEFLVASAHNKAEVTMQIGEFGRESDTLDGWADLSAEINYTEKSRTHKWETFLALSMPTAKISPYTLERSYDYRAQLGSGTYDWIAQTKFRKNQGSLAYGGKAKYMIRSGRSKEDYRLGDDMRLSAWTGYYVLRGLRPEVRLNYRTWGSVTQPRIHKANNPFASGGTTIEGLVGLKALFPIIDYKTARGELIVGRPFYEKQNVAGNSELNTGWFLNTMVNASF